MTEITHHAFTERIDGVIAMLERDARMQALAAKPATHPVWSFIFRDAAKLCRLLGWRWWAYQLDWRANVWNFPRCFHMKD